MSTGEHDPSILATLPLWVQVSANLGMFLAATIAAGIGFARRMSPKINLIEGEHDERSPLHTTGEDIRALKDGVVKLADNSGEMLRIMVERARQEEMSREVARQLKNHD